MALTREKLITSYGTTTSWQHPVAAGVVIQKGSICALNAAKFLVPMTAATGLVAVGCSTMKVDNTGGANGDLVCEGQAGDFEVPNSATDAVERDDVLNVVFAEDDEFAAESDNGGTLSPLGRLMAINSGGTLRIRIGVLPST